MKIAIFIRNTKQGWFETSPYVSTSIAGLIGLPLLISLLWPALAPALRFLLSGVSLQRAAHSFALSDGPMPMEARMLGIFGGFAVALLYLLWSCGLRRPAIQSIVPPRSFWLLGAVSLLLLAADGTNAFLADLGLPAAYPPSNLLRLTTGVLVGALLALLLGVSVAGHINRPRFFAGLALAEALFVLCAVVPFDLAARGAVGVGAMGVLLPLTIANVQAIDRIVGSRMRRSWLGGFVLAAAFAELAALAFIRLWAENRGWIS